MSLDPRVRPHPRSDGFTWIDHEGPFRRITAEQAAQYDEQGFFLLEGAVPADDLAVLTAAIDPLEDEVERFLQGTEDGRMFIARAGEITFTTHLVARLEEARRFVHSPAIVEVAGDLLGDDVRLYWDQAVYKKPGATDPFPWHQDNGYTFVEPQQYLTCWVALTDATIDNGCPMVVPGLHRGGTYEHHGSELGFVCLDDAPDAVAVEARAGDIVVFSSLTPHATGPNTTDEVRKAYIVQLAPDGAAIIGDDGTRTPASDPARQFPVLVGGHPVI